MRSSVYRTAAVGVMALGLFALAGCKRPVGTVKGKVTYMLATTIGASASASSGEAEAASRALIRT